MSTEATKTEVGSYFISNYPPFSQWTAEELPEIEAALHSPPRRRAAGAVSAHSLLPQAVQVLLLPRLYRQERRTTSRRYVAGPVARDRAGQPAAGDGRPAVPLRLFRRRHAVVPSRPSSSRRWSIACGSTSTGTTPRKSRSSASRARSREPKIQTLKELGVTRLSLGVENFSDAILEENGRAHLSGEVYKSWQWIAGRRLSQRQHRPDQRHGRRDVGQLEGEHPKTIDLSPDSVTIYQMELPFNTVYSKDILGNHDRDARRRLADEAGLAELRLRRAAGGGLPRLERLHAGEGPAQGELQLSRQPLAGLATCWPPAWPASGTSRACTIRTRPSGATTSSDLLEHDRLPLYRGAAADAASAAGPRDDPAAQEGLSRRRLLPPASSAWRFSTNGATSG